MVDYRDLRLEGFKHWPVQSKHRRGKTNHILTIIVSYKEVEVKSKDVKSITCP